MARLASSRWFPFWFSGWDFRLPNLCLIFFWSKHLCQIQLPPTQTKMMSGWSWTMGRSPRHTCKSYLGIPSTSCSSCNSRPNQYPETTPLPSTRTKQKSPICRWGEASKICISWPMISGGLITLFFYRSCDYWKRLSWGWAPKQRHSWWYLWDTLSLLWNWGTKSRLLEWWALLPPQDIVLGLFSACFEFASSSSRYRLAQIASVWVPLKDDYKKTSILKPKFRFEPKTADIQCRAAAKQTPHKQGKDWQM